MWCRGRDMRPRKTRKNLATTHSWWIAVKFLHTTESRAHAHYTITGSVLKSVSNVARTYTRRREQIHWSENSPNDFFFIHISSYFIFFYLFLLLESLAWCASRVFVQISFMDEVLLFVCVYWTNALIVFQRRHGWMHVVDACPLRPQTLCLCMQ